jgi:hypothetical protein
MSTSTHRPFESQTDRRPANSDWRVSGYTNSLNVLLCKGATLCRPATTILANINVHNGFTLTPAADRRQMKAQALLALRLATAAEPDVVLCHLAAESAPERKVECGPSLVFPIITRL